MSAYPEVDIERLLRDERARRQPARRHPPREAMKRSFSQIDEGRYCLEIADLATSLDVDRLRRERSELLGELCVRCDLPGAHTVNGILSIADFNLSSARARKERAGFLADRANAKDVDWVGILEEFCQRVLHADRIGQPAVDLRTLPMPTADDDLQVEGLGLYLLRRHPAILFGDGGTVKSYLALHLAGRLAQRGSRVAVFDWELAGEDHRARLKMMFGDDEPMIFYARCERPLVYEVDRLRRIARDAALDFIIYDSVAFACDGPPESAEVAGRYFRAVRQIGGGSLHIAHITKGENGDQKPFGSSFWHNGARRTWFIQRVSGEGDVLTIGLFNRKSNLGRMRPPLGFKVTFTETATTFTRTDVAAVPEFAGQLSVRQRMAHLLKRGACSYEEIAEEVNADLDTVKRTARRYKHVFTVIDGGRVGLLDHRRGGVE